MSFYKFSIRLTKYVRGANEEQRVWTLQNDGRLTTESLTGITHIGSDTWTGISGSDNILTTVDNPNTDNEWKGLEGNRISPI